MARRRPGGIFSQSSQDKELQELKSAVGSLNTSTQNLQMFVDDLSNVIKNDLIKSISGLTNETKTNTNTSKKKRSGGGAKKEQFSYKNQLNKMFDGMGGDISRNIKKIFGDKTIDNALKSFASKLNAVNPQKKLSDKQIAAGFGGKDAKAKLLSGKGPGGDGPLSGKGPGGANPFSMGKGGALNILGKAGGTLMRGAAGLMRAAGPIGAAFSIGMQVVDFFDSGKAAQMASDVATFFGGAGAGKDATKALFKNSKAYRQIVADYNIMAPIREEFAQRRDMMDFQKQAETDVLGLAQDKVKDEYNRRYDNEADWLNFAHSQAIANIDAEHERRKTLFMTGMKGFEKYIGIGERALNAIGSSTEAVLNTISSVGKNLGASVKDMVSMSAAAAGVSKLLGTSAEDVLSMGNMFRLMNKTSLKIGTNLTTGIKAYADKNGVMASVIMKDMTDSSAEIYKFSSGTAENFAKQAVALNKMGTSMNAMMKASDTMVLNYKDSIKAEMGLSAMLGRNVDLSETRAKLMSGDQAGAAESLRTALGGQDVGAMNAFQKQQLSQATGMDIEQLMSLQQGGTGDTKGNLEQQNAKKTGAAIADGALKQDIANEAKKVAMEQAMREKMLKFEQEKRKGMLFIEQSQRLENLAIEARWRLKYAALDSEEAIAKAVGEMQVESASKWYNNVFQDAAQTFRSDLLKSGLTEDNPKFQEAMSGFSAKQDEIKQYTMGLVQQGILTSENASTAMVDVAQKLSKGQEVTVDFVNKSLNAQGAFQSAAAAKEEEIKKAKEALDAAKANQDVGTGNWAERNLPFYRMIDWGGTNWEEKQEQKEKNDKAVADAQARLEKLQQELTVQKSTGTAAGAVFPKEEVQTSFAGAIQSNLLPVMDNTYAVMDNTYVASNKMLNNDDKRGQIFKKQYDYQAAVSNENVTATYAVMAAVEQLANAQGKPVSVSANDISSTIGRLGYKKHVVPA